MGSRKTVKVSLAPRASAINRKQSPSVTKARRGVAWSGGSGFEGSLSIKASDAFGSRGVIGAPPEHSWQARCRASAGKRYHERPLPALALEAAAHAGAAERGPGLAKRHRFDARPHLVEAGFAWALAA